MKKYKLKYIVRVVTAIAGVSFAMGVFGHGCGNLKSSKGDGSATALGGLCGKGAFESVEIDVEKDMLGILYGISVLHHFAACTGLSQEEISDKTYAEMSRRETAFSDFGNVLDVTAPLLMGSLAVSGEVCDDVVDKEASLADADRNVFKGWDFGNGTAGCPDATTLDETIGRIAVDRNCWSHAGVTDNCSGTASEFMNCRYGAELDEIRGGISRIMADARADNVDNTRTCAITLCATMLANLRGLLNK